MEAKIYVCVSKKTRCLTGNSPEEITEWFTKEQKNSGQIKTSYVCEKKYKNQLSMNTEIQDKRKE